MRSDRKFLSLVLAIVLVIGVCVPCFAEEAPAEEIIIEVPAEDVIIEEIILEDSSEEIIFEAPAEEIVIDVPAEEIIIEVPAEEIVIEAAEEPVVEEPVVEEPVVEEPVVEEPVVEEPVVEEPVVEEPVVEEPVVEEPVVEEPVVEAPVEEVVEEPVRQPIDCKVTIQIKNPKDVYYFGDKITFKAKVSGCEDVAYEIIWQYNDNDDSDKIEWEDAGSGKEFSYKISQENVTWQWRAVVVLAD